MKLPKTQKRELTLWTPEQVGQFLAAVEDDPDRELCVVAILSAARAGELLALTWSDVDWERQAIAIQRDVVRVPGQGITVSDAKHKSSRRLIALPAGGMAALRQQQGHIAKWSTRPGYQYLGLVVPKRDGTHRTDEGPRRKLQRIAGELGLPRLTFHDLRHLSASLSLKLGAGPKTVQQRLGHSSIDVTMNVYGHLIGGEDRELAEKLGRIVKLSVDCQNGFPEGRFPATLNDA